MLKSLTISLTGPEEDPEANPLEEERDDDCFYGDAPKDPNDY